MRRLIIALPVLASIAACAPAAVTPVPAAVDTDLARGHLVENQELPILRSRSVLTAEYLTLQVTVDETGGVTKALATEGPVDVRQAAVTAARGWRYQPFLIGGRARQVSFTANLSVYPPQVLPNRHVAFPAGDLSTARIRLERGLCNGPCPAYSVEIRGDGSVTYRGEDGVAIVGEHHARISPGAVAALVQQFRAAEFFSLQDEYQASVTEGPTYWVTLSLGGRTKVVTDYVGLTVGMPDAVARIETAIDRAAGTRRWVTGDGNTVAALKAEHWDFTSRDAGRSLIWNAGNGSESLARLLMEAGAPLERVKAPLFALSAVEAALSAGRLSLAKALIARGALRRGGPDAAERALIAAASSGRPDSVAEIITQHPAVNRVIDDQTALMATDAPAVVRLLLAAGADPNLQDRLGRAALHRTANAAVVRELIAGGARVDLRDSEGRTPLLAVFDEDAALALIDAGAGVNARDAMKEGVATRAEDLDWKRVQARLRTGR